MIIFFGSGIYYIFMFALLIILATGSLFATWLTENALGATIFLVAAWALHTFCTIISLRLSRSLSFSLSLGLLHCLPQGAVIILSYPYLLREIESQGISAAVLDYAVVLGLYIAAGLAWNRIVIRDGASSLGTIIVSFLHFIFSVFLICAFAFL